MKYTMIRGPRQEDRCSDPIKGRLYCPCGCQKPYIDDPQINLDDVKVSGQASHGYADYKLMRGDKYCGEINTQYLALILDGYEYLGCDQEEIKPLLNQIFEVDGKNRFAYIPDNQTGDTFIETAAAVHLSEYLDEIDQDKRNCNHPGYCTKCHSYCYGDCES